MILVKHGFDKANGIQAISMESPSEETAPTAAGLKTLQPYAGELNWLATRSRADLAYVTSLLASCLVKPEAGDEVMDKCDALPSRHC